MRATRAAAILALILWAPATRATQQGFTLVNDTGRSIDTVLTSAVGADAWGANLIPWERLDAGQSADVNPATPGGGCRADLRIIYADRRPATWQNLDLCAIGRITLSWDDAAQKTLAAFE